MAVRYRHFRFFKDRMQTPTARQRRQRARWWSRLVKRMRRRSLR